MKDIIGGPTWRTIMRFGRSDKKLWSWAALIFWASVVAGVLVSADARDLRGQSTQKGDKALRELRSIGKRVADAVLARDIERILRYDRPDMVASDRMFLKDTKSDLYCALFDTSCITWGKRSVYDILRSAERLAIRVRDLGKGKDRIRYGLVLFFDAATIDEQRLASAEFLCQKSGKEIVSWTFKRVSGKWESAHPPFDAETDTLCSPD